MLLGLSIRSTKVKRFCAMAADKSRAMNKLNDITECCICLKTFTDPRMLPCIHTFCFQCLQDMAEKSEKKPGDQLQCPICRKEFAIPNDGVQGTQKNFFMTGLLEVRNALNQSNMFLLACDVCQANNDATEVHLPEATMRCLFCQKNLCEDCCMKHKSSKLSRNHEIAEIGSEVRKEEAVKSSQVMSCDVHRGKVLDYYCDDCKKVVCVSCFVESHKTHNCKDVSTADEEFRQSIEVNAHIMLTLAEELMAKRNLAKKKKIDSEQLYLTKITEREKEISHRSKELKLMTDQHAKSFLSLLDEIKKRHLKEVEIEEEELDRRFTILESFARYCDEVISKGSTSEVCRSKDELLRRAVELEEDHETFIMRPRVSFDTILQAIEFDSLLQTTNGIIVGKVKEKVDILEDVVMIGADDKSLVHFSCKMNLHRPSDTVSIIENTPNTAESLASAAVYNNTMFITGVGEDLDEIWKYSLTSGWKRCGSLIKGREGHCAEFINETLYICGGRRHDIVMISIEAYNAVDDKSKKVGWLMFGSVLAASVAHYGVIYIFGGFDIEKEPLNSVQVYNPVENDCTILSMSMPCPWQSFQSLLWENYAILIGPEACLVLDLNENSWKERHQFKTNTIFSGLFLTNGRIFLIGGTLVEAAQDITSRIKFMDDVKYIRASSIVNNEAANWKTLSHLPKPIRVLAVANLTSGE